MGRKKYTLKDAARDTGVSTKHASRAWHQARQDARRSREIPRKRGKGGRDDSCFIATAAYGSELAPVVQNLREFRDEVLVKSFGGRFFIAVYCRLSPPVAQLVAHSVFLKIVVQRLIKTFLILTGR